MCYRSLSETVNNNVTIVEVINPNQVFNFNQMEQGLNQTNQQPPQTLPEPLINSPRPSRSTNENSVVSPKQSSRHHQARSIPDVDESVIAATSSNHHLESNDRITNSNDVPQRSTTEISNEGQRFNIRMAEPEDVRLRRKPKKQEVPPATNQELTSNYEHLVLPTALQSRMPPTLTNFVSPDITLLPTRPQVKFNNYFII